MIQLTTKLIENKMWTLLKRNNYYIFELFIFCRSISYSISSIAQSLLIQDKICLITYQQNVSFCDKIQHNSPTAQLENEKDHILADSAQFNNYMYAFCCCCFGFCNWITR